MNKLIENFNKYYSKLEEQKLEEQKLDEQKLDERNYQSYRTEILNHETYGIPSDEEMARLRKQIYNDSELNPIQKRFLARQTYDAISDYEQKADWEANYKQNQLKQHSKFVQDDQENTKKLKQYLSTNHNELKAGNYSSLKGDFVQTLIKYCKNRGIGIDDFFIKNVGAKGYTLKNPDKINITWKTPEIYIDGIIYTFNKEFTWKEYNALQELLKRPEGITFTKATVDLNESNQVIITLDKAEFKHILRYYGMTGSVNDVFTNEPLDDTKAAASLKVLRDKNIKSADAFMTFDTQRKKEKAEKERQKAEQEAQENAQKKIDFLKQYNIDAIQLNNREITFKIERNKDKESISKGTNSNSNQIVIRDEFGNLFYYLTRKNYSNKALHLLTNFTCILRLDWFDSTVTPVFSDLNEKEVLRIRLTHCNINEQMNEIKLLSKEERNERSAEIDKRDGIYTNDYEIVVQNIREHESEYDAPYKLDIYLKKNTETDEFIPYKVTDNIWKKLAEKADLFYKDAQLRPKQHSWAVTDGKIIFANAATAMRYNGWDPKRGNELYDACEGHYGSDPWQTKKWRYATSNEIQTAESISND